MKSIIKKITVVVALSAVVMTMSSCGKSGYGCPYEMKVPSVMQLVK